MQRRYRPKATPFGGAEDSSLYAEVYVLLRMWDGTTATYHAIPDEWLDEHENTKAARAALSRGYSAVRRDRLMRWDAANAVPRKGRK